MGILGWIILLVLMIYFGNKGDRWLNKNVWSVLRRLDAFLKDKGYGDADEDE